MLKVQCPFWLRWHPLVPGALMLARVSGVKHTVEFSGPASEEPLGCRYRVPTLNAIRDHVEVTFEGSTIVRPSLTSIALALGQGSPKPTVLSTSTSIEMLSRQEVDCDAVITSLDACALAVTQQNMEVLLDAHVDFCDRIAALNTAVSEMDGTVDKELKMVPITAAVRFLHARTQMLMSPYPSLTKLSGRGDPVADKSYKLLAATEVHYTRGEPVPPLDAGLLHNYSGLLRSIQGMIRDHNNSKEGASSQERAATGNLGSMGAQSTAGAGKYGVGPAGPNFMKQ